MLSRLSLIPPHKAGDEEDALKLHDGVSTDTREITIVASPQRPAGQSVPAPAPRDDERPGSNVGIEELLGGGINRRAHDDARGRGESDADVPERQPAKPKRSSIPTWDEIVFGTRGD